MKMSLEVFMSIIAQVGTGIAFSAFVCSVAIVAVFYSYKMAETLIRRRTKYVRRIKTSRVFREFSGEKPVQLVKKNGKVAKS